MAGSELGLFEWYVAVAAYHVDLPRGSNDGSAMWADILDAAVLAGAAPAFDGRGRFAALVIVGFGFDLERRFAAGGRSRFQQCTAAYRQRAAGYFRLYRLWQRAWEQHRTAPCTGCLSHGSHIAAVLPEQCCRHLRS